mgnify:FL=1
MYTLGFDGSVAMPAILIALVLATIVWMVRLAVGPFGHVKWLFMHQCYLSWPHWLRLTLQGLSLAIMLLALATFLGLVQFR